MGGGPGNQADMNRPVLGWGMPEEGVSVSSRAFRTLIGADHMTPMVRRIGIFPVPARRKEDFKPQTVRTLSVYKSLVWKEMSV